MKSLFLFVFILLLGFNIFSEGKFPNKHQFEVKNSDGEIFELDSDVQNIFDVLGKPLKKENLWAVYPNASCALYWIEYDGIAFMYYDINNRLVRIVINDEKYKIVDNDITVGATYEKIIESYGNPGRSAEYFNEQKSRKELQLVYSTENTNLSYVEQTAEHYYWIVFNIDVETHKCNSIYINWNVDN